MPRKGRHNLQPREEDEIVAVYQTTSLSLTAIAKRLDVCSKTVSRLLKRRTIAPREPAGVDTCSRKVRRLHSYEADEIVALYQTTSMQLKDIAKKFGVRKQTIYDLLKRRNVASRETARVNECPTCAELTRKSGKRRLRRCNKHIKVQDAAHRGEYRERWYPGRFVNINTKERKHLGGFDNWINGLSDLPSLSISLRSEPSETGADLYFQADSFGVRYSSYQVGHFADKRIPASVGRLLLLLEDYRRIDVLNTAAERIAA